MCRFSSLVSILILRDVLLVYEDIESLGFEWCSNDIFTGEIYILGFGC